MRKTISLLLILILFLNCSSKNDFFETTVEENHMGTVFQITALHKDIDSANLAVKKAYKEVVRIENLISSWKDDSETTLINKNAGISPVKVSEELFYLIERSLKVSKLTNGVFDISFASIDKIWHFDGSMKSLPDSSEVAVSVSKINYEDIVLNAEYKTVFLKKEGMKIGFGAIGKGYAANRCKAIMQKYGIESGVVNAGGDLICWGKQKNGKPWTIGIADPNQKESALSYLEISDQAVVTSGNYERFVEFDGVKYCHIIHPKTGWPVELLNSVTVICEDAELADALATSVFILGVDKGIDLINQLKGIDCFIIDKNNKLHVSKNIELEYLEE